MVQIHMIIYYQNNPIDKKRFGVEEGPVVISVIFAFLHICLQLLQLNLEASASQTEVSKYFEILVNARLGWTPFVEKMSSYSIWKPKQDQKYALKTVFDYCNISYEV